MSFSFLSHISEGFRSISSFIPDKASTLAITGLALASKAGAAALSSLQTCEPQPDECSSIKPVCNPTIPYSENEMAAFFFGTVLATASFANPFLKKYYLHYTQPQELRLDFRGLTTPPNVSKNPRLEVLFLYGNRLTAPPVVSNNPHLQKLDLSANELTDPPDVSHNPQLEYLHLSDNQLTSLPDSYLSLRATLIIYAERNPFPAAFVTQFQQRLLQHIQLNPGEGPIIHFSDDEAPQAGEALQGHQRRRW